MVVFYSLYSLVQIEVCLFALDVPLAISALLFQQYSAFLENASIFFPCLLSSFSPTVWAKNICTGAQSCVPIYSGWSCDRLTIFLRICRIGEDCLYRLSSFLYFSCSSSLMVSSFRQRLALSQQKLSQPSGI